jgi:Fe-S cluster assembly iron-binding protein IscA
VGDNIKVFVKKYICKTRQAEMDFDPLSFTLEFRPKNVEENDVILTYCNTVIIIMTLIVQDGLLTSLFGVS